MWKKPWDPALWGWTLFILVACIPNSYGQESYRFTPSTKAQLWTSSTDSLVNGFAGGLNNPQLSTLDINGDGATDLIIFDREGSRWLPFERVNGRWKFRPNWATHFPAVSNWVVFADYSCDGLPDLFCSVVNGVGVYSASRVNGFLQFTWALPGTYLLSTYSSGTNPINLLVSSTDVPAIRDVDGDGMVDILTFGQQASAVEFHRNMSNCGLTFERVDACWGDFLENNLTNAITIDACTGSVANPTTEGLLHSGSTILAMDLTGNGLLDILLGDVSFATAVAGYNVGTPAVANIESQDSTWPSAHIPVNLPVYPMFSAVDANLDGLPDIAVSPTMPTGISDTCVWLYENTGTANAPQWTLVDSSFLQGTMYEAGRYAVPELVDLNTDGLLDLLVGTSRGIEYWKNVGSASYPDWQRSPLSVSGSAALTLKAEWCAPTAADLNGDGLYDLLIGRSDGKLAFWANTGTFFNPAFTGQTSANYQSIDVGQFATPELADLDGDGDMDLLVGNELGKVAYFENSNGAFTLVTETFGAIDADFRGTSSGRAIPRYVNLDGRGFLALGTADSGVYQMDSLAFTQNAPASLDLTVGTATTSTSSLLETPWGSSKRTGRHQYLIRANELAASGLTTSRITHLSLQVTSQSSPYLSQGFSIRIGHSSLDSLTGFAPSGQLCYSYIHVPTQGWNTIALQSPFDYDGVSNLIVEICFSKNVPSSDVHLSASTTPYPSHAYGDVFNNNSITSNGCTMPFLGSDSLRPDFRFTLLPRMPIRRHWVQDGRHNTPVIADMDGDGRPEMVMGLSTGGLRFYAGDTTSIGLPEWPGFSTTMSQTLRLYPNPGSSGFWVDAQPGRVHIVNAQGQVFWSGDVSGRTYIEAATWPAGLYVIHSAEGVGRWIKTHDR